MKRLNQLNCFCFCFFFFCLDDNYRHIKMKKMENLNKISIGDK